jgi:hypothetical protein
MKRAVLGLTLGLPSAVLAAPVQDQAQYKAAVRNTSTAPSYVLVTIVDDRTGQARTGCVEANAVEGALHRELHLTHDDISVRAVQQRMLKNRDRVFHFSDPSALATVSFGYTAQDLQEARAFVKAHLDEIASHRLKAGEMQVRMQGSDAFACALIEQGYQAQRGDRNPIIFWSR